MTDYKQLCAELAAVENALIGGATLASNQGQALDGYSALASFRSLANRARAALAEPEPEPPTDEELLCIAAQSIEPYDEILPGEYEPESNCAIHVYGSELIIYARAVWALGQLSASKPNTSLQPIPVSERMPTDEDCDKEGTCWWWHPDHRESDAPEGWMQRPREWGYVRFRYVSDGALVCTHWLPAYALPLPTHD